MKVIESSLKKHIKLIHSLGYGELYVFDDFIVSEMHEGINLDYDKSLELLNALLIYSDESPVLKYITNRVAKYSVDLPAFLKAKIHFNKPAVIAHVNYDKQGMAQSKFEKAFCNCSDSFIFNSLSQAAQFFNPATSLV